MKNEYIYKDCKVRLSKNSLYLLTYAAILTKSDLINFFGVGIYELSKMQNARNYVDVKVHLHPSKIEIFEKLSNLKLTKPIKVHVNSN